MPKNINIEIPDETHKLLKVRAIQEDKTLKELIVETLSK